MNSVISLEFYKSCDDQWECGHGACSAFEKALRVCLSNVSPEAYPCTFIEGRPAWGVTTTARLVKQGAVVSLLLFLMLTFSVLFVVWSPIGWRFDKERAGWAVAMLVPGLMLTVAISTS